MNCKRCDAEAAEYAEKREGYARLMRAITREDELAELITSVIFLPGQPRSITTARAVIDAVRAWDEQTCLMRDARDDHTAQNNEGQDHAY